MKLPLSLVDIFVLAVFVFFVVRNAWIGFFRGLSSLAGIVAGYLLSLRYGELVEKILSPWFRPDWLKLLAYALSFLIGFLAVFIVAELLTRLFKKARLSWLDHLLGAALGALKAFLLLAVIFILITTFYPRNRKFLVNSQSYPYLMKGSRFLVDLFPSRLKARFNYNLRHILGYDGKRT